jgi:hypothetical protein
MSLHPIASLKAALRAHLLADSAVTVLIGSAIHDQAPRDLDPPYLVFGPADARENATNDGDGRIVDLELQLFTFERGSAVGLAAASVIEASLAASGLTLTDHRLVLLTLRETQVRQDATRQLTRVNLRYRSFTEPL